MQYTVNFSNKSAAISPITGGWFDVAVDLAEVIVYPPHHKLSDIFTDNRSKRYRQEFVIRLDYKMNPHLAISLNDLIATIIVVFPQYLALSIWKHSC